MTIGQIDKCIQDIKDLYKGTPVIDQIILTGGEPLLHKRIKEIFFKISNELVDGGYVNQLKINSNLQIKAPPELEKYIINFTTVPDKPEVHGCVLVRPQEFGGVVHNYFTCRHYRKNTVVLCYHGYFMCCAGDGYARLMGYDDLFIDKLPETPSGFPLKSMDKVCNFCPFSNEELMPKEKDLGLPVSPFFAMAAQKNRLAGGSRIKKRFPEK
jgi:hypothetical protein